MSKIAVLFLVISFLITPANIDRPRLEKYKKLEAYEIRPGILMFPRFTAEDEFCEIGLQRLGYSPEVVRVSSSLSQEEIDRVLDGLVPAEERGKRLTDFPDSLYVITGASRYGTMEFENVSVVIAGSFGAAKRKSFGSEDVVATIKWKKRVCK